MIIATITLLLISISIYKTHLLSYLSYSNDYFCLSNNAILKIIQSYFVVLSLLSVTIYYINYFSTLLGQNERMPEVMSMVAIDGYLTILCDRLVRINEK